MFRSLLIAVSAIAIGGICLQAHAQPAAKDDGKKCEAVFSQNKAEIEKLAAAGNKAGIQRIMSKNGCRGAAVNIGKRPATKPNEKIRIVCTISFPPLTISCRWGSAA